MPRSKIKMLATIAGLVTTIAQPRLQNSPEVRDWQQKIFLPTNLSENISYPGCECDRGPFCDSCSEAAYLISCEGCTGTYFKDNPRQKTIELDGSWSPEGQVFDLELKKVGDEVPETRPQKVTVIRVPKDCQFRDLIQKSFKKPISQDTDSDSHLSEVTFGLSPDLVKKCGALNFGVQRNCVQVSAQTDDSVTLAWDHQKDDCQRADGSTDVLLTISLQQHPRTKLDVNLSSKLFSYPADEKTRMNSIESEYETVATQNWSRNLGTCGCTTSLTSTQPLLGGALQFAYEECSGPYIFTLPPQQVLPMTCTNTVDYADWDISTPKGSSKTGCQGPGYDKNIGGGADNKIPISSSVTLYCRWAVVAPTGQSITINSCSDATDPYYTGTGTSNTGYKTTYTIKYDLAVYFPCSDKTRGNLISDSFTFSIGAKNVCKAAGSTTMVAPILPPINFNFAAGMIQTPQGYIPAFDDTKSAGTTLCGTRTCTSDSPYAVWSQTNQKFTVGSTGYQLSTDVPGTHLVTLICQLTCCPLIPPVSSSWSLVISASCYTTALVTPQVEANYNLYTGITTAAATIIKWQDTFSQSTGADGTGSDLCGTRTCTTNNSIYAVWNSATQTITVKVPTGNTAIGVFPVTISCSLSGYTSVPSKTVNFTVTVSKCTFESIVATTVMSGLGSTPLVQTVLGTSKSWTLDTLTSTSLFNCQYTFTYHVQMKNTGSTDFTPFGGSLSAAVPPVLSVYTADPLAVNTYDLQWYVTSAENTAQTNIYVDFQVQIKDCVVVSTTGTTQVAFTRALNIYDPVYSSTLSLRTQTPACGYTPVYSCQVKEAGTAVWLTASWCTLSATNLLISPIDYLLDGKSFDVQQTTAFSSTYQESQTVSSTVTFTDPCKTTSFVAKTVPNQVYFITSEGLASPPFNIPWLDDSVNQQKGTSTTESICYKQTIVITDAGATPKYTLFSPKNNGFDVTIATSDITLAGQHTLIASYTFQRYSLIPATQISVIAKLYYVIIPKIIDQAYSIKGSELKFTFDTFYALPASPTLTCVQKVTLSNDSPLPGFITVVQSDTNFIFSVLSGDDLNFGTYTIKIAAKFTEDSYSYETNSTFKVLVTSKTQKLRNQAPTFDTKLGGPFNLKVGENFSYKLPSYSDPEGQNVTLTVDLDLAGIFMTHQVGKIFIFTATNSLNIGTFPIQLKLTDSLGASTKYSFDVIIQEKIISNISSPSNIQEQELTNIQNLAALESSPEWNWLEQYMAAKKKGQSLAKPPTPLTVRLTKISILGEVQVRFSKPMVTPPLGIFKNISEPRNITNTTEGTKHRSLLANQYKLASKYKTNAIIVKSIQGEPANQANLDFEYNVTGYHNQTMTIQLEFVKANVVSQYYEYDLMQIIFNGNYFFFDQEGQFVEKDTVISYRLPSQLQYGENETAALVEFTAVCEEAAVVLMSSNLVLNLLLSAALNQLVSMVRIMQIVVLMPLFNIRMPGNAALFFGFVMEIVSFDMIPMEDFYDMIFPDIEHQDDQLSPNFAQIGITQTHFLYNLGSLILAFVAIPFVLLLYPVLIPCKKFPRVENFRRKIWTWVFWSHTITTITESYVILVICVCINTLHMQFTENGSSTNSILAIIYGVVLIVFPLITCIFVFKRINDLQNPLVEASYGAFYEGLELNRGRSVVWELVMFFFRRIFIPAVVIYQDHLIIQVMAVSYTTVGQVIILGSIKPHQGGPKIYYMELFSECILMLIMYTMMMFTEFIPDLQTRRYIGFASMALVCFHLGVSFGLMLKDSFHGVALRIKWWLLKRENFKIREAKIDAAVKTVIVFAQRIDIIQEVDESLEESQNRRKSGRRSGRRKSTEKSPNQSMLRSEPDIIQVAPDAFDLESLKQKSEDRLIEDHNYELDMTTIVKEVDQQNQSVFMDATVVDIVADIEGHHAETEARQAVAEDRKAGIEALRAFDNLPENKATSIFIPDMKKINHANQRIMQKKTNLRR